VKSLWGGRFEDEIDPVALSFVETTAVDAAMVHQDIWCSQAHAIMLAACGILDQHDLRKVLTGLADIQQAAADGEFGLAADDEDVHMNIERRLIASAGDAGARLHTARSRNDQVITDTRLHTRQLIIDLEIELLALQETLLDLAGRHVHTITVGYTHTQHAQPITLGFWATGYVGMFARDQQRLQDAYRVTNLNPLGACALAGTSFPTDRRITTDLLGFDDVIENSLDAVSSRDFGAQMLAALAILMSNVSKLAEEIVYWSTWEFGTISMADGFAMGSSIMPQKKNPCVAELIRAKAGRVYGRLVELLTLLKGIPSGYNRDLQDDKPPIWEGAAVTIETLRVLRHLLGAIEVNEDRMRDLTYVNFALATELADYLVRTQNRPFRHCHRIVGEVVLRLVKQGRTFADLTATVDALADCGVAVATADLATVLTPEAAVAGHTSMGGTAPAEVERMIAAGRRRVQQHGTGLKERRAQVVSAFERTERIASRVRDGYPLRDCLAATGQRAAPREHGQGA
jgi:argininosuccinate lyase